MIYLIDIIFFFRMAQQLPDYLSVMSGSRKSFMYGKKAMKKTNAVNGYGVKTSLTGFLTSLLAFCVLAFAAIDAKAANIIYQYAATKADKDSTYYGGSGGHAVWLPDIQAQISGLNSPKFLFNGDGVFTEFDDGTATLTGTAFSEQDPTKSFLVNLTMSSFSSSPKKELKSNAYKNNDPVDTSTWRYYFMDSGSLIGTGDFAGLDLALSHRPSDGRYGFQVGVGANGKNINLGMSGWFSYVVTGNTTGYSINNSTRADFNLDLEMTFDSENNEVDVAEPISLGLMGMGLAAFGIRRRRTS